MNVLSALYGAGVGLSNALFDHGIRRALRLERPVVSIGNLSTGGSGKTPFVIALGELLKERGIRFDVLSRGYGRTTRGVLVVDPEGPATDFGDEPLLIARRLGVPVVVGERRYEAGRVAEQKFQTQLHLLDDGFQHRALARDFDILLMTASDFEDRLLPVGRLREPLSSLTRADAIVLPARMELPQHDLRDKTVWHMQRDVQLSNVPSSPIVFCGIARPKQFFAQVRAAGIEPAGEVTFRDHHAYNQNDVRRLVAFRGQSAGNGYLTTEKDAINLGPHKSGLEPLSVAVLRLTLDRPADLVDTILARIADRKPRS